MKLLKKSLVASACAIVAVTAGAPLAGAAEADSAAYSTGKGVTCETTTSDTGERVSCGSATPKAYLHSPECILTSSTPTVILENGVTSFGCGNRGSSASSPEAQTMAPGDTVVMDHHLLWADHADGIHVAADTGNYGYAGPDGVADHAPTGIDFMGGAK